MTFSHEGIFVKEPKISIRYKKKLLQIENFKLK